MTQPPKKRNSAGYDISKFIKVNLPKPKKRVRKPTSTWDFELYDEYVILHGISRHPISINYMKRLHNWLGRAIQYLEHKGE